MIFIDSCIFFRIFPVSHSPPRVRQFPCIFFIFYRFLTFRIRFSQTPGIGFPGPNLTMVFYVYMIRSGGKIYVGATTDTKRRLQQHNGELSGGASYTRGTSEWRYEAIVSGFRTWREALQFEWALKHHTRKARDAKGKTQALHSLLSRDRWTVNSPLASEVPLTLELTSKQASRIPMR